MKKIYLLALTLFCNYFANGRTFYLDPANGNMINDGSLQSPWTTLQAVINANKIEYYTPVSTDTLNLAIQNSGAPVKGGDTLVLMSGYQGEVLIQGLYNLRDIVVMAAAGATPKFKKIRCQGVMRWQFLGLSISPSYDPSFIHDGGEYILFDVQRAQAESFFIIVKNCNLFMVPDITGFSKSDWNNKVRTSYGIEMGARYSEMAYNHIKNISLGIELFTDHINAHHNIIENIQIDGSRIDGSYCDFDNNVIKNFFGTSVDPGGDDDHNDMMQAFNETTGVRIRNNLFIAQDGTVTDSLRYQFIQGLGCFDGFYTEWLIENNLIITRNYHGITLKGAIRCIIRNNTVIDINDPGASNVLPWIVAEETRDGRPSQDVIIANNIVESVADIAGTGTLANNIQRITQADKNNLFVDLASYNLHLKQGCAAINAGNPSYSSTTDYDGFTRGSLPDIGAYEYFEVLPIFLLEFTGSLQNNMVLLGWSTSTEINSKEFIIEKSTDGVHFYAIGSVPAAGNSTSVLKYSFFDANDIQELNFYRLRMININGLVKLSSVVLVKNVSAKNKIYMLATHFTDYIDIRFTKLPGKKVKLELLDITGKSIAGAEYGQPVQPTIRLTTGTRISQGIYFLKIIIGEKHYVEKIFK